jgi:hypothetical protein
MDPNPGPQRSVCLVNAQNGIAIGTAAVALIGAIVAVVQARSANDSAASARRQATAAEEQVQLMRRQIEADMVALDEAAGPSFEVGTPDLLLDGERFVRATLVMVSGPPLSLITACVRGDDVRWLAPFVGSLERLDKQEWRDRSPGGRFAVVAQVEYNVVPPANVTLDLECVEAGGKQRRWSRSYTMAAYEPPPETNFFATWR